MPRLLYLEEAHFESLVSLAKERFPDARAFELREPEGLGLLISAFAVPTQPNYRTLPEKAAALQYHLNMNHPFFDGNKRFSVIAMETFLGMNGAALLTTNEKVVEVSLAVASHAVEKQGLIRIIEQRTFRAHWAIAKWRERILLSGEADVLQAARERATEDSVVAARIRAAFKHD